MSVVFVAPGRPMRVDGGRVALWRALRSNSNAATDGAASPTSISNLSGWWDASDPSTGLGITGTSNSGWNNAVTSLADKSGSNRPLTPYSFGTASGLPTATARLSGLLGGLGHSIAGAATLAPTLDADMGFQVPGVTFQATGAWTRYLVWSRPNWRQGSGRDSSPIVLLMSGSTRILQADSAGGAGHLLLFPGSSAQTTLTSALTRRHTHSIVLRNRPGSGIDVWLDDTLVASAAGNPIVSGAAGPMVLLHDTTVLGSAQCWLHEVATWERALSDPEMAALLRY